MSLISKPNVWVDVKADSGTQLTYALQTDPAPLTVSVPGSDPLLASLEFVITNQTGDTVNVDAITFTLQVGTAGSDLTTSTAGILTQVSDTGNWSVTGPGSVITQGQAQYVLGPVSGSSVPLAAGASVVVEIYQIPTVENTGTTTIGIKEMTEQNPPAFTTASVTTFPDGFYLNGLVATVEQDGALVPVAQVASGATVTLVWNCSVVDMSAIEILYSSATDGQRSADRLTDPNSWTTPQGLTSDTVFTLEVHVSTTGGQPLTATLSTVVSVQNPALVASSLTVGLQTAMFTAGTKLADGLQISNTLVQSLTDGFAVVHIYPSCWLGYSSYAYGGIYTAGQWFQVQGGNVGQFGVNWQLQMNLSPNAMTLPIPAGSYWQYAAGGAASGNEQDSAVQIWWFPLGSGTDGNTYRIVPPDQSPVNIADPPTLFGTYCFEWDDGARNLVDKLSQAFGTPLDDDQRDELVALFARR
ncbi:hypothetical protein [Nonomuraea sediminis]|uniref:hypothetical protein n=1 Tax=Nonomuraea sediminis TaxID=2835864 RepID=UPI001BDCA267|nr:hypothetical protein [Nonomuraea sediminis]